MAKIIEAAPPPPPPSKVQMERALLQKLLASPGGFFGHKVIFPCGRDSCSGVIRRADVMAGQVLVEVDYTHHIHSAWPSELIIFPFN